MRGGGERNDVSVCRSSEEGTMFQSGDHRRESETKAECMGGEELYLMVLIVSSVRCAATHQRF